MNWSIGQKPSSCANRSPTPNTRMPKTQTAFLSGDHSTMVAMCLYVAGKSKHVPLLVLQP